jgi:hypothetical protein
MTRTHGTNGKTFTLGLNLPPEIAAAIRREGNRRGSISAVLFGLIDQRKLKQLLAADAERMIEDCRRQAERN